MPVTPFLTPSEAFRRQHVCRTDDYDIPKPLKVAYAKSGRVWKGTDIVMNYKATIDKPLERPPALCLRGEFDFVSEENISLWGRCFRDLAYSVLFDCSHHGLLENPELYAATLQAFWKEYEGD
jgi:pimeloyl-ACP methyl ester carboxylesterase